MWDQVLQDSSCWHHSEKPPSPPPNPIPSLKADPPLPTTDVLASAIFSHFERIVCISLPIFIDSNKIERSILGTLALTNVLQLLKPHSQYSCLYS